MVNSEQTLLKNFEETAKKFYLRNLYIKKLLMMDNKITQLFNIQYPIIHAGMIWWSGWELASAVSNAGGLGLIGSGSMYPDVLQEHIKKCRYC